MKLCKDCDNYGDVYGQRYDSMGEWMGPKPPACATKCYRDSTRNLVDGCKGSNRLCLEERSSTDPSACGSDARYFTPIKISHPKMKSFFNFLK